MSEQVTIATLNNNAEATRVRPITYSNSCISTVTICSGPDYCPHKDKMEEDIRAKVQKEVHDKMFSEHSQPRYGGAFYSLDENGKTTLIYLKKVIYQKPATIAFWSDGTKTIAKCSPYDTYNTEMGLLVCYAKKMMGSETINKLLDDWRSLIHYDTITLADVRRRNKE